MTRTEALLLVQSPYAFDHQRVRNAIHLAERCRRVRGPIDPDCSCVACMIAGAVQQMSGKPQAGHEVCLE